MPSHETEMWTIHDEFLARADLISQVEHLDRSEDALDSFFDLFHEYIYGEDGYKHGILQETEKYDDSYDEELDYDPTETSSPKNVRAAEEIRETVSNIQTDEEIAHIHDQLEKIIAPEPMSGERKDIPARPGSLAKATKRMKRKDATETYNSALDW